MVTLLAGAVTLIVGWPRRSRGLRRYSVWALADTVVPVVAAFWVGGLEL